MSIQNGDLKHLMLKKISIDEFKPKSGDSADVLLIGFYLREQKAAEDLYTFLNFSRIHNRDIEVSPNPNDDGYYMVFVEFDRKPGIEQLLNQLLGEVERLCGKLPWEVRTHLMDDYLPVADPSLKQYIITMPANYMTRKEFDRMRREKALEQRRQQRAARQQAKLDRASRQRNVYDLLRDSNLADVKLRGDRITLRDARDKVTLQLIDVGDGKELLDRHQIAHSALNSGYDYSLMKTLNSGMLGSLRTMPLNGYILIYDPQTTKSILTRPL